MSKGDSKPQTDESKNDNALAQANARAEQAEGELAAANTAAVDATDRAEKAESDLALAQSDLVAAHTLLDDADERVAAADAALKETTESGEPSAKGSRGEEIDFLAEDYDGPMTGQIAEMRHKHKADQEAAAADEAAE